MKPINEVKTAEEARQIAIDWQGGFEKNVRSWQDSFQWVDYFVRLAQKFPELKEEFEENGII